MKFTLATIVLLAGFAVALPQNAKQDAAAAKVAANAKADDTGNAAANDGSGVCTMFSGAGVHRLSNSSD